MANLGNTIINGILRVNGKINAGDSITAPSFIGDLAGNAATATKANQLTTARTINGTSFNGTANITTANWGTARTIKIGNSGKSVNGSANVTWTLAEIGAAASSHTHSYLPLAGGTMTGALNFDGGQTAARNITWTGETYQQRIAITDDANSGTAVFTFQQSSNSGTSFSNLMTIGDNGKVTATTFAGALSGNATTATSASKLTTARTISLSGDVAGSASFDGSRNITITTTAAQKRETALIGSDDSGAVGWYKVMEQTMSGYANSVFTFAVSGSGSSYFGILTLNMRSDRTVVTCKRFQWLSRIGFDPNHFIIVIDGMKWTLYHYYTINQYDRTLFEIIAKQKTNGIEPATYTFQDNTTKETTTPTATVTSTDGGTVLSATKLTTARTIGVSGVTGTAQSFNGTKNIVIPITAVPASLLTGKSSIKGSEITNDKHWVPSSDNSVKNFMAMSATNFASNAGSLSTGTIVAITDGVEGYVTTQSTGLTCDLPLDL